MHQYATCGHADEEGGPCTPQGGHFDRRMAADDDLKNLEFRVDQNTGGLGKTNLKRVARPTPP